MKLTLAEPKYLKESIMIISDLVNDVTFKVDQEKIELIAMDPANVAMVIFRLLSSAFLEYEVEKHTLLCVNLDQLKQVLKRAKPSDTLQLQLDEEKNRLNITLKGDNTRNFHLALIHLEEKEQKIPQLTFPVKIEMQTSTFDEAIEDMDVVGDSVVLQVDPQKFIIQASGTTSEGKVEFLQGDGMTIDMDQKNMIKAKYSIEYLKKIIKGSRLSEHVSLWFDKDYPLKVEYKVIDKLSFSVILAPRVSDEH